MTDSVSVQEEMHSFWTKATYVCGILTIISFLVYLTSNDPLWSSILSFITFIFFALAVLGCLKIMNGPLTVTLETENNHLLVSYNKNLDIIQEEQFERSTIKEVRLTGEGRNVVSSYLLPKATALRIHFTDTDTKLYLFEFGGRPLFFNQTDLQEIRSFLEENGVPVKQTQTSNL
ncbi:MAG TPA: hypothetical protein VF181_12640 [Balneolaceae bacterium]